MLLRAPGAGRGEGGDLHFPITDFPSSAQHREAYLQGNTLAACRAKIPFNPYLPGPATRVSPVERLFHAGRGSPQLGPEFERYHCSARSSVRGPHHVIRWTSGLSAALKSAQDEKGAALELDELILLSLAYRDHALTAFSPDAPNALVAAYYRCADAPSKRQGHETVFVVSEPFNSALFERLKSFGTPGTTVRVKELCVGTNLTRWDSFSHRLLGSKFKIEGILSDFEEPAPELVSQVKQHSALTIHSAKEDLLNGFNVLEPAQRYHAMLVTYGFDCVWLPGDFQYLKCGNEWYKTYFRVVLPNSDEILERVRRILGGQHETSPLRARDVAQLRMEVAFEGVDILSEPYGDLIKARAGRRAFARINSPMGLVHVVEQAFHNQLRKDGVFLIGDVGAYRNSSLAKRALSPYEKTLIFREVDFALAQEILQIKGYVVQVDGLSNFVSAWLKRGWQKHFEPAEAGYISGEGTYVMSVSTGRSSSRPKDHL